MDSVIAAGITGLSAGLALTGSVFLMEPRSHRRNRLVLASAAQVAIALVFGAVGLTAMGSDAGCEGYACIGASLDAAFRTYMAWAAAIGLAASAGVGLLLALLEPRHVAPA